MLVISCCNRVEDFVFLFTGSIININNSIYLITVMVIFRCGFCWLSVGEDKRTKRWGEGEQLGLERLLVKKLDSQTVHTNLSKRLEEFFHAGLGQLV